VKRGDLYRVSHPSAHDPKRSRVFVVVSRQILIDSKYSTVICAPVFSRHDGLSTQILIGTEQGLKHNSSVHCDELLSLPKEKLSNFVGSLSSDQLLKLDDALKIALDIFE